MIRVSFARPNRRGGPIPSPPHGQSPMGPPPHPWDFSGRQVAGSKTAPFTCLVNGARSSSFSPAEPATRLTYSNSESGVCLREGRLIGCASLSLQHGEGASFSRSEGKACRTALLPSGALPAPRAKPDGGHRLLPPRAKPAGRRDCPSGPRPWGFPVSLPPARGPPGSLIHEGTPVPQRRDILGVRLFRSAPKWDWILFSVAVRGRVSRSAGRRPRAATRRRCRRTC
jgi:hypothetical protein